MWYTNLFNLLTKGIGLVSNFGTIIPTLQTIGANIIKYWQYWLIAVLLVFNALTGYELNHTRNSLKTEVAAHARDITDFKNAQAEADKQAAAVKAALTKESKADADKADASYSILLARYRGSLLRFSSGQGGSGSSSDSQFPTTQGGDGPSSGAQLPKSITISGDDAGICAVNTARLQAVHDWATSLPKETR